jgi:hypothetical protein
MENEICFYGVSHFCNVEIAGRMDKLIFISGRRAEPAGEGK